MISERIFARSFEAFWQELLPLLTPRFVATSLTESGRLLGSLSIPDRVDRVDVIAEFAFRLARLAHQENVSFEAIGEQASLISKAESQALELIHRYEGGQPAEIVLLSPEEKNEGLRLCHRYPSLFGSFSEESHIEFCPRIPGAGFLDACEGDISIGDCLVEVKTTTRKPSGQNLRQLIVYAALDANVGSRRWKEFESSIRAGALYTRLKLTRLCCASRVESPLRMSLLI
ncbi:MAG: hypothetical protein IPK15_24655 [Verrucomicrobia bacterium]|nr:hypothetical protein [Verrucomicrobiota bacterium]